MQQYLVTYVTSNSTIIEADSEQEAYDKFFTNEYFSAACEALRETPVEITDIQEWED